MSVASHSVWQQCYPDFHGLANIRSLYGSVKHWMPELPKLELTDIHLLAKAPTSSLTNLTELFFVSEKSSLASCLANIAINVINQMIKMLQQGHSTVEFTGSKETCSSKKQNKMDRSHSTLCRRIFFPTPVHI